MKQSSAIPSITIIGMGALGILYADIFTRSLGRESVTFLADKERIHRYRTEGVFCNGNPCDFQMSTEAKPADLLIFAVKGTALEEAIELARPAVGENTIILSLLNGISSEEIIASKIKQGHIIHCIAQGMDAVKLGNKLTYAPYRRTENWHSRCIQTSLSCPGGNASKHRRDSLHCGG